MRRLATTLLVLLLTGSATSAAEARTLRDRDGGYRIEVETASGAYRLRLDRVYRNGGTRFEIGCGRRRHGAKPVVAGVVPTDPVRTLKGGFYSEWKPRERWCVLRRARTSGRRAERVAARWHLHH